MKSKRASLMTINQKPFAGDFPTQESVAVGYRPLGKLLYIVIAAIVILTMVIVVPIIGGSDTFAAQKMGCGKATSLVTKDYTFLGKATDTFTWSFNANNNNLISSKAKQSCTGIKNISTLLASG